MNRIAGSQTVHPEKLPGVELLDACRNPEDSPAKLEPVWLRSSESGVEPVWVPPGFERTGEDHEALVIEASGQPGWVLTLTLWNRYGGPDPVETGRVLEYLDGEGDSRLLELLDLPNADEVLAAYRQFPDLPPPLREPLREEELSPRLFRYLQRVPDELELDLIDLLAEDTRVLSVQEMRRLSEALRRLPPDKYDDFRNGIDYPGEDRSPRSVGDSVLERARRLAFPEVAERREAYERDRSGLDLDGRIDVEAPDNFEGDYIDVSLRCRRDEDLEKLAEEVKKCRKLLEHV